MFRKSDEGVVPLKPANKAPCGAAEQVEGRASTKRNSQQIARDQTQSWAPATSRLLAVRQAAQRSKQQTFNNLFSLIDEALLKNSFYQLKRSSASGCDGVTWSAYEMALAERIASLSERLHTGRYKPKPARRVFISKEDGSMRPLSIICLEDKIVQQALSTILNQIYEVDFLGFSYGFRPERGQHDALDALMVAMKRNRVNWVLDLDLQKFFDTIDHSWLLKFIGHRVSDRRVHRLITQWLKVGVLDEYGHRVGATQGSPQGAVISPLLSNIYLHYVFDLWVNKNRKGCRGRVSVVRFADDAVLGFEYESDAKSCLAALSGRLEQFGLRLHPEKTRLIPFSPGYAAKAKSKSEGWRCPTFDFLGFTHYIGKTRRGRMQVKRKTKRSRLIGRLRSIRRELKGKRLHQSVQETGQWLNRVILGHMNYYAVPGNARSVGLFILEVKRAWLKALRRRSQRHRMTWERFIKYLQLWIPKPRVMHPYPDVRFDAKTQGRSRMR